MKTNNEQNEVIEQGIETEIDDALQYAIDRVMESKNDAEIYDILCTFRDNVITLNQDSSRVQASVAELMDALTDDERMEIIMRYCRSCGRKDPRCQCWNDE